MIAICTWVGVPQRFSDFLAAFVPAALLLENRADVLDVFGPGGPRSRVAATSHVTASARSGTAEQVAAQYHIES